MPLEQAQFIDSLTPEWPLGSDPRSAGDDHIRMIKQVLQNTFPNVAEAVTATPIDLNNTSTHWKYEAPDEANHYKPRWVAVNDDYSATIGIRARALAASELADPAMHDHVVTFNAIMGMLYPVGGVYITSRAENPAQILGFGTWVQRSGIMYGAGGRGDVDGMHRDIPLGDVPGHWRVHPEHIFPHQAGGYTSGGEHEHSYIEVYDNGNSHDNDSSGIPNTSYRQQSTTGGGSHAHGVTVDVGNGLQPFAQPGHAFYVWERTA